MCCVLFLLCLYICVCECLLQMVVPFHLVTFRPFSWRWFSPCNRLSSTRCRQTSAANTLKSSPSTKPLSALVLALPALGIAHWCRAMSQIRGPLASVMMSSTAFSLSNSITIFSPGSSTLRSRNAPNPRKGVSRARPSNGDQSSRHCTGISPEGPEAFLVINPSL